MKHINSFAAVISAMIVVFTGCGSGSGGSESSDNLRFRKTKEIRYDSSGTVAEYTTLSYDTAGNIEHSVTYSGPGSDETWFTGDDSIMEYGSLNADTSRWNCYTDNVNESWFDDNDLCSSYRDTKTDQNGMIVSETERRFGADSTFNTPDDQISFSCYIYGEHGSVSIGQSQYSDIGSDGIPFTSDDTGGFWKKNVFNSRGLKESYQFFYAIGKDKQWFTDDDLSDERIVYIRNGTVPVKDISYEEPGADSIWNTGDDTIDTIVIYSPTGKSGEYSADQIYSPGADGKWETGDDGRDNAVFTSTFDSYGNLTKKINKGSTGVGYEYEKY